MCWKLLILFTFVAISSGEPCPRYPTPVELDLTDPIISNALQALDLMLQQQKEIIDAPGLICSEMIWSKGYGNVDPLNETSPPPSVDTVVRIASITKTFTVAMLYQLRDLGIVNLDDPVINYLPSFSVMSPYISKRPITLRQLASHSSGLQRETPCYYGEVSNCTEQQILDSVAQTYVVLPQYYTPHYSNLGMALLGRSLEKAVGTSYENYVEKNILAPLSMNSSTFAYNNFVKENIAVSVFRLANGSYARIPVQLEGWSSPDGGLFSTARDMSSFVSFLFRDDQVASDSQIFDGQTIHEYLKPIIMDNDGYSAFGTPWEFKYVNNYWIKSKAGDIGGFRSQVAIVPPIELGIFCSANAVVDDSSSSMLTIPALEILIPAVESYLWQNQPPYSLPPNAELYTGLYEYIDPVYGASYLEIYINETSSSLILAATDLQTANSPSTLSYFTENTLRAQLIQDNECRWINDGTNLEFVYFFDCNENCGNLVFMAEDFQFVSKNCPQC